MGGRAPYGYRLDAHALPETPGHTSMRARERLTPEPDEAPWSPRFSTSGR